jgi:hypothetical protein
MKKFIIINLFLSAMGLISGCKHDYPEPAAPEISFSKHVQPIISGSCTAVECHGSNDELSLLDYSQVINLGEIKDADEPKLLEVLKTTDEDDRMPRPPAPPLTSSQIQIIELWIKQGAKNN